MSSQKKGGWGSIFSGAVANLESRLDTILAEDSEASARERAAIEQARAGGLVPPDATPQTGLRDASRSRVNDRLAERLAKATQAKTPSRASTPVNGTESVRASGELKRPTDVAHSVPEPETLVAQDEEKVVAEEGGEETEGAEVNGEHADNPAPLETGTIAASRLPVSSARISMDSIRPSSEIIRDDTSSARPSLEVSAGTSTPSKSTTTTQLETESEQAKIDHAQAEAQRQEEMHSYLERIDALQAKLTYLAKETVAAAKEANAAAAFGSADKRLAEKDERIALLMQEGDKLSQSEMRHLQTIKRLRAKGTDDERAATEFRKKAERLERSEADLKSRLRRAEVAERQANEKTKQIAAIDKQVEELRIDRENASELIRNLTTQLKEAKDRAERAETDASSKASEADKDQIAGLQNDLEDAQIEKKLAEDRATAEVKKVQDASEREHERAEVRELELKSEISGLESRLEAVRARAETSAGEVEGESSVKLMRQVETLQQQYSLAKSNWETIEGSLTARVVVLERERNEASKREGEARKKAREMGTRSRQFEEELENARDVIKTLETELRSQQEQVRSAQLEAKDEVEKQRRVWDSEIAQRIEDERQKWRRETLSASPRNDQLPTFARKASGADGRRNMQRHASHELAALQIQRRGSPAHLATRTPVEASPAMSRRESNFSLDTPGHLPPTLSNPPASEFDDDGGLSPSHTIPDLLSTSTPTMSGGPSVALVERMSALVRKLETEKSSFRDELTRLSLQRDQARDEVVTMMREREIETKERGKLRGQVEEMEHLRERYEASLEMLGEREEEVEELRGDVVELKRIYRDLAEGKFGK